MERIKEFFEKRIVFIISSIFFVLSLILLIIKNIYDIELNPFIDPGIITILLSGTPLLIEACDSLVNEKKITSELLVSIALIASLFIKEVFAAGEVAYIMALGELLENITVEKAKKGLNDLINIEPKKATKLINDKTCLIDVQDIKLKDIILVKVGEEIPIDGIVVEGNSYVDEKTLTGESVPKEVYEGVNVYAGSINTSGILKIEATKIYQETSLYKMINLLKNAQENEAPIKRIADKWASVLVPVSVLISIITGIITFYVFKFDSYSSLIRAITIIVVFCPCALTLSTPTSVVAAIGQATKKSIIIKSGSALEQLGKTDVIFFDKTGTLTNGKLEVTDVISTSKLTKEEIIYISYNIEKYSEHPISKAIIEYSNKFTIKDNIIFNYISSPGKGISANLDGITYLIGNEKQIKIKEDIKEKYSYLMKEGKVLIYLSNNDELLGIIALNDTIRKESKNVINSLYKQGIKTILLTGDNYITAEALKGEISIDEIHASLLPNDKVNIINDYNQKGINTVMIGDGMNDAPSMATANVGISLSSIASDITKEASDITLMNDNLENIPYLTALSKKCINTIRFNIILSLIINLIAILLSIFGLLNPTTGAIWHNIGSVIVVLNASLLYKRKVNY